MANTLTEKPNDNHSANTLFNLAGQSVKPLTISVHINSVRLRMKIDTGASVSVISDCL